MAEGHESGLTALIADARGPDTTEPSNSFSKEPALIGSFPWNTDACNSETRVPNHRCLCGVRMLDHR
eukprot:12740225-Alexandrium_andersonii.AAC.1